MTGRRIPLAVPDLSGNEERYVQQAIRSSWISSSGEFVSRFEREFADLCGTHSAIAVANGTMALHVGLLGLDVAPGDEVIVPSLTYVATANAVRYVGGEPVFVDVEAHTWCLDASRVEASVTSKTRGIIAVHLYGHPADMDAIAQVAARYNLWVIEDAAEAPLATYKGRRVGQLGALATFSFYGNKILTSGEGGAITLSNQALERRLRILRGQGMDPERRYYFPIIGYNYRLTNVACALLCAQLERRDALLRRRREIFTQYRERLAGIPGIDFQPVAPWAERAPWLFCITVDGKRYGRDRDDLVRLLDADGIETRPFFIPLHTLPPYVDGWRRHGRPLPVTERLGATGMNLPTYPQLADQDLARVAAAIQAGAR